MKAPGTISSYASDLRRSLDAWAVVPWLPVTAGVLAALFGAIATRASTGQGGADEAFVALPLQIIVAVGLPGVAVLAYLTTWAGKPLGGGEVFGSLLAYLPRYVFLTFVLAFYSLPLIALTAVVVGLLPYDLPFFIGDSPETTTLGRGGLIVQGVAVAGYSLIGTFAVPELALRTSVARTAVSDGIRMLWQHRRVAWPYALAPLVLTGAGYLGAGRDPETASVASLRAELVLSALATIVGIWLLGAVSSLYLRLRVVHPSALPLRVVVLRGAPDPLAWSARLQRDALATDPSHEAVDTALVDES